MKDITSDLAAAILSPSPLAATQAVWEKVNTKTRSIKLDLGAGAVSPEGFAPLGNVNGSAIFPLPHADNTVDVIRASHVLEHWPHAKLQEVVKEWVRALKPGGVLRIAVPDFRVIAEKYLAGEQIPTESYIMGGQVDGADHHGALFDRDRLRSLLAGAGLVLLRPWVSDIADCASYPISLNIEGTKPFVSELKVSSAMSIPRLGFNDMWGCAMDALLPLGIHMRRQGGAYWGQALTNCLEIILDQDNPDAILTLDYDTVFTKGHVAHLMQLMMAHPEADAITAIQSSRHRPTALFTKRDENDAPMERIAVENMSVDMMQIASAHFGLTLFRADKLKAFPKPWFHSVPSSDGRWQPDDDHVDEDIQFWLNWQKAGNTLFLANRVAIGHIEIMARWPGKDLQTIYQPMGEFNKTGAAPEGTWK
jgi:SAM-dependent methyltransferase